MKMPFLGKDWRSPGDQWVRTHSGWEKLKLWRIKVFENLNENLLARLVRLAMNEFHSKQDDWYQHHQPHIHYNRGITRERKILTSLSEAFIHLDMSGAAKDIRRFNYVSKVLEILLSRKLTNLSGTTQKYVIDVLQDLVNQGFMKFSCPNSGRCTETGKCLPFGAPDLTSGFMKFSCPSPGWCIESVIKTKTNVSAVRDLLNYTVNTLTEGEHCHIGSRSLWHRHIQNVNKMVAKIDTVTVDQRVSDGLPMFGDLPEDCIRCILTRMVDHRDIMRTSQTNRTIHVMAEDKMLWKQMCFFHFSNRQLITFLPKDLESDEQHVDWKYIYKRCFNGTYVASFEKPKDESNFEQHNNIKKRFGKKDVFADNLAICCNCDTLFWKSIGHPCLNDDDPLSRSLSPAAFIQLFSL